MAAAAMAARAAVVLAVLLALACPARMGSSGGPARRLQRAQNGERAPAQTLDAQQVYAALIGAADAGAQPTKTSIAGHDVYYQLPPAVKPPRGLVLLLHKW